LASHVGVLGQEVAPPGVTSIHLATEPENRIELDGHPGCFVPPVLEEGLARPEELLGELRIEAAKAGKKDQRMATSSSDRDGVELEVAEVIDDPKGGSSSSRIAALRPAG
jgi:hypothetical protein